MTLPAGEMLVGVDNRPLAPRPRGGGRPPLPPGVKLPGGQPAPAPPPPEAPAEPTSSRYIRIPDRYYQVETSGLKITVQPGEQPPIEIKLDAK